MSNDLRRFDSDVKERIRAAVAAAESGCELELVVRVVPWSGSYRDVPLLAGAAAGALVLAATLFAPIYVDPIFVLPDVLAGGALVGWMFTRLRGARRLLTTTRRRRAQVEERALAEFHREAVSATRARTGVLLLVSMLEGEIALLVDHPLEGKAPRAAWDVIGRRGRADGSDVVERLLRMIADLGELGRQCVPPTTDNPNELPDEPRIG